MALIERSERVVPAVEPASSCPYHSCTGPREGNLENQTLLPVVALNSSELQ
jgi:hypothetical protein